MNKCSCGHEGWVFHVELQPTLPTEYRTKLVARCVGCGHDNTLFIQARPSGDVEWDVLLADSPEEWPTTAKINGALS